jgi:hypothetical protein
VLGALLCLPDCLRYKSKSTRAADSPECATAGICTKSGAPVGGDTPAGATFEEGWLSRAGLPVETASDTAVNVALPTEASSGTPGTWALIGIISPNDIYPVRRSRCPNDRDARKISAIGSRPPIRYRPIEVSPAEAMQPHSEHTGFPPN